jgi:ribose/xylose/arabinose/galactoside ABC-type transport system permease subunit
VYSLKRISWKTTIQNLYVLGVLALLVLIFSSVSSKFIGVPNVTNILRQSVPALLVGASVTLLMISGNIDLSVGGILGLTSVVFSLMIKSGFGYFWASILTLILGVALGFINGFLVMKLRIVPVIATLATMSLCIGLGKLLSPTGVGLIKGLPSNIGKFARTQYFLNLPIAFYVALVVIAFLVIIQKKTVLGKYAAAIGGNRVAAELSGINAVKTVWLLYIIVGLCSSLGGISRVSLLSLGDPATGVGMELDAMIAVVLGGTSFTGGEGSVARTMVGVLILICLTAGMQVIGMQSYWQSLVKGIVLILAVVINSLVKEKIID